MNPKTFSELYEAVKNKEIVSAKSKTQTYRFFIATNENLCYFAKGRSRCGYTFDESQFKTIETFQGKRVLTEQELAKQKYNSIAKYRKLAEKATFTNDYIRKCRALPKTFSEWVADGSKDLYGYAVTTGCKVDGQVISIDRIAKQYRWTADQLRQAIANQAEGSICYRQRFAGYDMSIEADKKDGGDFRAFLSLEYKGCGNGYYYLLINDDNFIGYDVD